MRFLLSAVIWIVLVGGLWLYTSHRDAGIAKVNREVKELSFAQEAFTIEITTTFTSEADPFALQTEGQPVAGIDLRLNGSPLVLPDEPQQRGQTIRLTGVTGVVQGPNEIFVLASPPLAESHLDHGLRVRLVADGNTIADHTFWSSNGASISNSFNFIYQTDSVGGHGDGKH